MPPARPADVNAACYAQPLPGREDYWRKMASPRHRLATLLALLRERPPERLADLGCGDGTLLREVRGQHPRARLCGIDLSAEQIRRNAGALPEVEWLAADVTRLDAGPPFLRGGFDSIVASELVEHLEDPALLLRGARALALPGARLLLSTQSGPLRATERRVGHHRHYEQADMQALLSATGWRPLRVWNCGFPFHDLSKWAANLDPDAAIRRFGEGRYGAFENLVCLALRLLFRFNSQRRGAQLYALAERAD